MKTAFFFSILMFYSSALTRAEAESKGVEKRTITHKVTEAETPWFLAQVYYGKGALYTRLLQANGFSRPEEMKQGMEIRIVAPEHWDAQPEFSKRYSALWETRSKALGLKIDNRMPSSKVVLPTVKILSHDSTPRLPFTEVKEPGKSPVEMANEELRQHPRNATAHGE